jgi:hypothetical protein
MEKAMGLRVFIGCTRFRCVFRRYAIALGLMLPAAARVAGAAVDFNREVRPILSDKCFHCHGPDESKRKAKLRLDTKEGAFRLKDGEAVIVPGKSGESELIHRVLSKDEDEAMPPPDSKLGALTPAEVATLKRWIDEGAAYQSHWAFVPLTAAPAKASVAGSPIDRIVSAGLAKRRLANQPEADRTTLIRRVSLDLTGLPPTTAEIDAFVRDAAPGAYERLVDRLLASPRYGERMATDWLDVARYADSYGFQVDRDREMWPWRDWVIKAFNENLPWDKFVTWQLAGDLLPNATEEQVLATAFNRLHPQESEGGSVEEEYRVNYVNDRVTTFGTAFLGLTLECARCHDHKFDPISQKEFYQLFAFFDDVDEAGLYSYFTMSTPTPTMWLPDPALRRRHDTAVAAVRRADGDLKAWRDSRRAVFEAWLAAPKEPVAGIRGERAHFDFERPAADQKAPEGESVDATKPAKAVRFSSVVCEVDTATTPNENLSVGGRIGQGIRLTGDHAVTTNVGSFHRYEPFSVSLWLQTPDLKERAVVMHRSRAWTDAGSRGYELLIEEGRLKWSLIHFWPGDAISIRATAPVPLQRWVHVTVTSDGSSKAAGLRIYVDGRPAEVEVVRDNLTKDITGGGGETIALGERFRDRGFKGGLVDELRVFGRALTPLEAREVVAPGTLATVLAKSPAALTAEERSELFEYFTAVEDASGWGARLALNDARAEESRLADEAKDIMVMRETDRPKVAYVLKRGDYHARGEAVGPETPAALPRFPTGAPRNRLGLARWLTAPDHPLLARVTVNRFWQSLFGRGLVKTSEDFGTQGEQPEYPELLDWLAGEFVRSGWDVKTLHRTIVLSGTYRQRSFSSAEQMADDPENVLLARGPRHRLPAEMIRDQALAVSGLLVERIGGAPVHGYDAPESFKPAAAGKGEELYRRSLYTFWRRNGPAPVLEAFDMPKRVVCVARRDVTNTPLHAFVLLNGPQFVEAARVLGEALWRETGGTRDALVAAACQRVLGRLPDAVEAKILGRLHDEQLAWFQTHSDAAVAGLKVGARAADEKLPPAEVAAAAVVVNTLMNHDSFVVKR